MSGAQKEIAENLHFSENRYYCVHRLFWTTLSAASPPPSPPLPSLLLCGAPSPRKVWGGSSRRGGRGTYVIRIPDSGAPGRRRAVTQRSLEIAIRPLLMTLPHYSAISHKQNTEFMSRSVKCIQVRCIQNFPGALVTWIPGELGKGRGGISNSNDPKVPGVARCAESSPAQLGRCQEYGGGGERVAFYPPAIRGWRAPPPGAEMESPCYIL